MAEARGPSNTAIRTAMRRAAHYLLDDKPVLADTLARAFAGFSSDEEFLAAFERIGSGAPWHRVAFALRNRITEDGLANAVRNGVHQYVILGAGLDSFAYRRSDSMQSIVVFEVDHPASQAWKRERIAALGIDTPPTLRYAPIDFERTTLTEGLIAAGLDRHEPVFFGWMGVTQYLTRDTGLRTLGEIANVSSVENILAAEFVAPPESLPGDAASLVRSIAAASAAVGEPWLSFYTSDEMRANMVRAGFHDLRLFGPDEAYDLYLSGRPDGARVAAHFRMAIGTTRIT